LDLYLEFDDSGQLTTKIYELKEKRRICNKNITMVVTSGGANVHPSGIPLHEQLDSPLHEQLDSPLHEQLMVNPADGEEVNPAAREGVNPAAREGVNPAAREGVNPAAREGVFYSLVSIYQSLSLYLFV
jgi:hypothetical protein